MRKALILLLLAAVVLLAVGPLFAAGLSSGDWPKPRRDAGNRGCSPTTAVAKPSIEWVADTFGHGVTMSNGTYMGPVIDANNVYTNDAGNGPNAYIMGFKRDGTYLWTGKNSAGGNVELAPVYYVTRCGITLFNDGTQDFVLAGPGATAPDPALWWLNASTGVQPAADYVFRGFVGPTQEYVAHEVPVVGPDGTIYESLGRWDTYYNGGTIYAIDGLTHALKWSWGADSTPVGASLGYHYGPMCVATVAGKTVLIFNGTVDPADTTPNIYALQDDGTSCSVLWSKRLPPSRWSPTLSNDGKTVYIGTEQWQSTGDVTLFAFDVATGTEKWAINPHAELFSSPAVGKDGTIYLSSTCVQANLRDDYSGKLIAVTDNGDSATIKWTMALDYESDSWYSSPVVTSGAPPTIYFGSTSGRTYAVQDLGSTYKVLWSHARPGTGANNWPVPAIANDGHVYIHQGRYLIAFKTGYDGSPLGVSGYVKNRSGDPVTGACVNAVSAASPMLNFTAKWFVKTDASGRFNITLPAGTWYLQAWQAGRLLSDPQTVVVSSDGAAVTAADIVLPLAGPNLAANCAASTNSPDDPAAHPNQDPSKAFDGDTNSRFTSNEANAANISTTNPTWLMVDLGSNKSVAEATMKWETASAVTYQIQCLSDGVDPTVEANWTASGVTVVSTTIGGTGLPWKYTANGNVIGRMDVAKFAPTTGRYWRIYCTASNANFPKFLSIWEWELRDGTSGGPDSGACGDVRQMADGAGVVLENKRITAMPGAGVPDDTCYVEDANRAGAIRVHTVGLAAKNLGIGDVVTIGGAAATLASGEKYIEANTFAKASSVMPSDAVVMNSKAAAQLKAQGLFVKLVGKVTSVGSDNFVIDDGGIAVKVVCGSLAKPEANRTVRVRGVISTDGSAPSLLMRNEQVDWAYGDAEFQPLPFPGPYKYVREFLVCGPFADATSATDQTYRLDNDFIKAASGVAETDVRPSAGDACGSNVWKKAIATGFGGDALDFISIFPTNNTNCTFYAHIYVWSPIDQDLAMRVGSDDSIKVFVNGLEAWRNLAGRGVTIGEDGVSFLPMQAGLNSVLLKVEQGSGGSGVNCQIVDPMNTGNSGYGGAQPFPGLGYVLNKIP